MTYTASQVLGAELGEADAGARTTYDRVVATLVREELGRPYRPKFDGSHDVYSFLQELADADREKFIALHLDNKHQLVCLDLVSIGSLTAAIVHPREVFKIALLTNARAIILAHNHPSGDPTPSREDVEMTKRLREAGELLGVQVLDHIVVGHGRYVSFVDDGFWEWKP